VYCCFNRLAGVQNRHSNFHNFILILRTTSIILNTTVPKGLPELGAQKGSTKRGWRWRGGRGGLT